MKEILLDVHDEQTELSGCAPEAILCTFGNMKKTLKNLKKTFTMSDYGFAQLKLIAEEIKFQKLMKCV